MEGTPLMSIFIILTSLFLWGALHSLLASNEIKRWLTDRLGGSVMRGYRLFYNILAFISFLPVLYFVATLPDTPLYVIPYPFAYGLILGQALGVILLIIGILQTDTLSFIGMRQLLEGERSQNLIRSGLYKYVRHPLYSAGLLMLWLSPSMTINSLVFVIGATLYILLGAFFEEKKLVKEFGQDYLDYKSRTPMLIPFIKN